MGNERAETYLRLLAEVELRRAGNQLRGLDAAGDADVWPDPRMLASTVAEGALWTVIQAGQILVAAGALDQEYLGGVAADLHTAITARSRLPNRNRRTDVRYHAMAGPSSSLPPPPAGRRMRITPIGRTLRVASDRAPAALHLMSLLRTQTEAVITVVMRMSWPPDGSSTDLEITGAGPHHLPYDQLWAEDDQWTRYAVRFEDGDGGTAAWRGIARLSPVPPPATRRLDLVGDGTRLIQLPLRPGPAAAQVASAVTEPVVILPGERLLVATAGEPYALQDGLHAFRLRLTPPLAAVPDTVEVVVTGPGTRVRGTVAVQDSR